MKLKPAIHSIEVYNDKAYVYYKNAYIIHIAVRIVKQFS